MATPSEDQVVLKVSGNMTIGVIGPFHQELSEAISTHSRVAIDVDDDGEFDLTLIQLIESARRTAADAGRQVALASPASGALRAMLERGGFVPASASQSRQFWLHEDLK